MNQLKDMMISSKDAAIKTGKSIKKNPIVFAYGPVTFGLIIILGMVTAPIAFIGSLILFVASCLIISAFLYYIDGTLRNRKFNFSEINYASRIYMSKVMGVMFITYLGNYLIFMAMGLFSRQIPGEVFFILSSLIILAEYILLCAVPETIYKKSYNEVDSMIESMKFVKANIAAWLIPNVFIAIVGAVIMFSFATIYGISSILLSVLLGPAMIFRGYLYEILSSSSIRKRNFTRNN